MKTVLLYETDVTLLDILKTALEIDNFKVYTITDEAFNFLEIINRLKPHVVLLDYKLSGDASKLICRKIKDKYPHLPVIALSCNNNIHEVYAKNGFDDYISKPFDLDLLYKVLRKHVTLKQGGYGRPPE